MRRSGKLVVNLQIGTSAHLLLGTQNTDIMNQSEDILNRNIISQAVAELAL